MALTRDALTRAGFFIILSIFTLFGSVDQARAAIELRVTIDSGIGFEGDSLKEISVFLDNPEEMMSGFVLWVDLDRFDFCDFKSPAVDTQGTLISGWEFVGYEFPSGNNRNVRVFAIADLLGGAITPGVLPQSGGLLVKLRLSIRNTLPFASDSTVAFTIYPDVDTTQFSNNLGYLMGTTTLMVVDTFYFRCEQWVLDSCLNWIETELQYAESSYIDTVPRTEYDSTSLFVAGSMVVRPTIRGDANGDGRVNVGDGVYLVNRIFKSAPPPQVDIQADANCDSTTNVADAVFLLNFIFEFGPSPGCP